MIVGDNGTDGIARLFFLVDYWFDFLVDKFEYMCYTYDSWEVGSRIKSDINLEHKGQAGGGHQN